MHTPARGATRTRILRFSSSALLALIAGCGDSDEQSASDARAASATADAAADARAGAPVRSEHADGLVVELQQAGEGRAARSGDRVRFHQRITSADGLRVYDSTWASGVPLEARLGQGELIAGLERGLGGLAPGARAKLEVPSALAWGSAGFGSVPAETALVIEVEVLEVAP